jgi:hypothetical protein
MMGELHKAESDLSHTIQVGLLITYAGRTGYKRHPHSLWGTMVRQMLKAPGLAPICVVFRRIRFADVLQRRGRSPDSEGSKLLSRDTGAAAPRAPLPTSTAGASRHRPCSIRTARHERQEHSQRQWLWAFITCGFCTFGSL